MMMVDFSKWCILEGASLIRFHYANAKYKIGKVGIEVSPILVDKSISGD